MASSRLVINLDAISANYHALHQLSSSRTATGATVKANGYGLGAFASSLACYIKGCRIFFVARLEEAIALKDHFNGYEIDDIHIVIFEGITANNADIYTKNNFLPVLNSAGDLAQIEAWQDKAPDYFVHVDTAMNRLGLPLNEAEQHLQALSRSPHFKGVMSHLACADMPAHTLNAKQLDRFKRITCQLGQEKMASLANSGGILLGKDYHFDLCRPGIALTGTPPDDHRFGAEHLTSPLTWEADILQIRTVETGESVGYGADFIAPKHMRVATVGAGYADGYPRMLSSLADNTPRIEICGKTYPLVGRISMDTCVVDITDIPEIKLADISVAKLMGEHYNVSEMARDCGTIGYEILTTLGARTIRQYNSAEKFLTQKLNS